MSIASLRSRSQTAVYLIFLCLANLESEFASLFLHCARIAVVFREVHAYQHLLPPPSIALLALEAATVGLVSWFAVGSLCALLILLCRQHLVQFAVFLAVSFLCLVIIRPLARKYADPRRESTTADRVVGAEGVVTQAIDNLKAQGQIAVNGAPGPPAPRRAAPPSRRLGSGYSASRASRSSCPARPYAGTVIPNRGREKGGIPHAVYPIIIIILVVVLILVLATNLKVVQQSKAYVIERLGAFHSVWAWASTSRFRSWSGWQRWFPSEQVVDFPPQPVITKDNVTMRIDTVLYFQITDPKLYAYGVGGPCPPLRT